MLPAVAKGLEQPLDLVEGRGAVFHRRGEDAAVHEAVELVELFQWLTEEESAAPDAERRRRVGEEMADVLWFLVRIADRLDIDLLAAAEAKLAANAAKYPAERVRGQSKKYDEY